MLHPESIRLRQLHGSLLDEIMVALFRCDPMGLNFEENTDEYNPEARTILPRLESCSSALDVRAVMHEEFRRWFGADIAGPADRYSESAEEIWKIWQRRSAGR